MSFDREGHEALKRAADVGEQDLTRTRQAQAFKFLLDSLAEQRLAIRALNDRVKALSESAAADARYGEMRQDSDDPTALEVW